MNTQTIEQINAGKIINILSEIIQKYLINTNDQNGEDDNE